jgi:hypothetical protein
VCQTAALPFTLKSILSQKKNYGNSNISPCKNILIFKKSSKTNQNPSGYYDFITNLKLQHKSKYHLSKISYKNRPINYLGAKIPPAIILYNESKQNNILALVGKVNKTLQK